MWQLYALAALFFQAGEEVVDKIVIVADLTIDTLVATFYRNLAYCAIAAVVGLTGVLGHMTLFLSWPVALVGALFIGSALFYTYLLKHVELTGASALGYSRPIIFLLVDILVLKAAFSGSQVMGLLLLIAGGLLFAINPLTHRLKPEYTKYVWLIFFFETLSYAAEFYVFKHYSNQGLNEISYIFSTNLVMIAGLTLITVWKGTWKNFTSLLRHNHYLAKMLLSKGLDFTYVVFVYQALKLATVSQVSAMDAFYPLILLVSLYILQKDFKFKAGEKFDRTNLTQKTLGTAVLILGIWLSS
jgi:uncharacterized membrane protein